MNKRFGHVLVCLLTIAVFLSGCTAKEPPETTQAAETILRVMVAYLEEAKPSEDLFWVTEPEEVGEYVQDCYGLSGVADGAIVRMEGARAFELAVLRTEEPATEGLQQYLSARKIAFVGYAPDQADLVENGQVYNGGDWYALTICEDTDTAKLALESCFGQGINATGIPAILGPSPEDLRPDGRVIYNDPQTDDMTLYDTSAILSAWRSGDTSQLSKEDRATLAAAEKVLETCIEPWMTDYDKEASLYKWLVGSVEYDNSHYSREGAPRASYEPYGPLVKGKGVCLGFASTFQLLMDMADVECITVVGASYLNRSNHAWNMVRLAGEWYCVDPTWEEVGEDGAITEKYFNVTSDYMAETNHQWDYDNTPEATAEDGGKGSRNVVPMGLSQQ